MGNLNLIFLTHVRTLGRKDINEASLLFGVPKEVVELVVNMDPSEILEKSTSQFFAFELRKDAIDRLLGQKSTPVTSLARLSA